MLEKRVLYDFSSLKQFFNFVSFNEQASHGYVEASGTLLKHGADVTITDDNGRYNFYHYCPHKHGKTSSSV